MTIGALKYDFVCYNWCSCFDEGSSEMIKLYLDMILNNCDITVEFYWHGDEPDWEGMTVCATLPSTVVPEAKHFVKVNDLLSDSDWIKIEHKIYENEDKLKRQAEKYDF